MPFIPPCYGKAAGEVAPSDGVRCAQKFRTACVLFLLGYVPDKISFIQKKTVEIWLVLVSMKL